MFRDIWPEPSAAGAACRLPAVRGIIESLAGPDCRYQHIVGQVQTVCEAGTLIVWHHNTWHRAQPNRSDRERVMFKVRLDPMVEQVRLWRADDVQERDLRARFRVLPHLSVNRAKTGPEVPSPPGENAERSRIKGPHWPNVSLVK